ncbi:MAG: ABC transporter permease [Deltaproteobacteria bacterium]|nr:ABC transporter permease [Deltaproteobacteria bacterium]MBW2121994.1 ABC transporter permease [Deltaproteobacteria bacterium]
MRMRIPRGVLPVFVLLLGWEVLARSRLVPEYLFPPFSRVLATAFDLVGSGELGRDLLSSLIRVVAGFLLGALSGMVMGIVMGWNEKVGRSFGPVFGLLYPIPALGWLPLLMIWVGIREALPILIIGICSFFPVLYNTSTGIRSLNPRVVQAARTLGASDLRILWKLAIPMAISHILTGLRLEAGMGWRVVIAAEMVAIPTGIGALLIKSESLLRVDIIVVCLIVLSLMGLLFERLFAYLEERMTRNWR